MLWIAHALTLSRIPLGMALAYVYGDVGWTIAIIGLAALTDTLDGNVARALQRKGYTEPAIGGWLDPLMDKIFIVIVLAVIWMHTRDFTLIFLIGARELFVLPLAAYYLAKHHPVRDMHADVYGKAATVAQFIAVAIVIGYPPWAIPAAVVTAVIGTITGAHYVVREMTR